MLKKFLTFIAVVFVILTCTFMSWTITCGIIKLIAVCFGIGFSFKVATGIWLILMLLKFVFGAQDKT